MLAIPILAALIFLIPTLWGTPWSIDHFFLRSFIAVAAEHPMLLSYAAPSMPMVSTATRMTSRTIRRPAIWQSWIN